MRLVVGISGASGAIYGIRALEALKAAGVETHLVVTAAAKETIRLETEWRAADVEKLATRSYRVDDSAAAIASGSFRTDGMVIIPCSMKTLGGVASGYDENLLLRAADVTMKEKRPLVLVVRETPLTLIQIENMARVVRSGATLLPAMPAFYHRPKSVDDIVNHVVGKSLDLLNVKHNLYKRWEPSGGSAPAG